MTPKVDYIEDIASLEALYNAPGAPSLRKVATRLTPLYRKWIAKSRYCIVSTVGDIWAEQTRGEEGGAIYDAEWQERAARTLW